jgi:hypothetical protein
MARAFDPARPGKGFPHALARLREFLAGGQVQDFEEVSLPDVGPTEFTPLANQAYELRVHALEDAVTVHDLDLMLTAAGALKVGHRLLVTYASEVNAGASVTLTEGADVVIREQAFEGGTPGAVASITFAAVGDAALLEYRGVVGGDDEWNVVYLTGTAVLA